MRLAELSCMIRLLGVLGGVRIAALCADRRSLCVLEGVVRLSATAAPVRTSVVALHELLLAHRLQVAGGDLPSTLERPGRRKRPARAAIALVLDRSDRALLSPVHRLRQR